MGLPSNGFKAELQKTDPMFGVWTMSGSPDVAEALGCAGYDFLVLDMEHSPLDAPRALQLLRATAATPASAIVRLPWNDAIVVKHLLDFGALTLMFPYIQNADEARRAVASTRYPPHGIRGFAAMSRATRYGGVAGYAADAQSEIGIVLQLETRQALENLEEIAGIDGVDSIFVGPGDLSADMGHLARPDHAEVQDVLAATARKCRTLGVRCGILAANPAQSATYLDYGYNWVASGSDLGLMMTAARKDVAALRAHVPNPA